MSSSVTEAEEEIVGTEEETMAAEEETMATEEDGGEDSDRGIARDEEEDETGTFSDARTCSDDTVGIAPLLETEEDGNEDSDKGIADEEEDETGTLSEARTCSDDTFGLALLLVALGLISGITEVIVLEIVVVVDIDQGGKGLLDGEAVVVDAVVKDDPVPAAGTNVIVLPPIVTTVVC